MTYQKNSVSCDRASSLLLVNFAKGAGSWGFSSDPENSLAVLMDLSADDSKGV